MGQWRYLRTTLGLQSSSSLSNESTRWSISPPTVYRNVYSHPNKSLRKRISVRHWFYFSENYWTTPFPQDIWQTRRIKKRNRKRKSPERDQELYKLWLGDFIVIFGSSVHSTFWFSREFSSGAKGYHQCQLQRSAAVFKCGQRSFSLTWRSGWKFVQGRPQLLDAILLNVGERLEIANCQLGFNGQQIVGTMKRECWPKRKWEKKNTKHVFS